MEWASHFKKPTHDRCRKAVNLPRPIPYFDPTNNDLLRRLSPETAARYLANGVAYAERDIRGRVRRLYRAHGREVAHSSAAWLTAASKATQRIRDADGVLVADDYHVEFKERAPARFGDPPAVVVSPRAVPAVESY